jgi:glutamyl endopeptidase
MSGMNDDHRPVSSDDPELESVPTRKREARPLATMLEDVPGYGAAEPDAAAGAFALERVFGGDDRTLVPSTTDAPWRWSAALRIKPRQGDKHFVGTGWFIGPRTLVTAGHCVYMHDLGGFAESIEVIPGLDGTKRPFGSIVSRDLKSVSGWTAKRNSDFDYGVIVLPRALDVGAFAFAAVPEELLVSGDLNISGYPADRDGATRHYFHARRIVRASTRRLYYHIDTFGGQSGSAAWITISREAAAQIGVTPTGDRTRVAVAVHSGGSTLSNYGTRITADVVENLKMWSGL